jgi:hypothetical protein
VAWAASPRMLARLVRKFAIAPVALRDRARRFFCDEPSRERRISCERLPAVPGRGARLGTGVCYRPEELERAYFASAFSRVLDALGCARFRD